VDIVGVDEGSSGADDTEETDDGEEGAVSFMSRSAAGFEGAFRVFRGLIVGEFVFNVSPELNIGLAVLFEGERLNIPGI